MIMTMITMMTMMTMMMHMDKKTMDMKVIMSKRVLNNTTNKIIQREKPQQRIKLKKQRSRMQMAL